MITKSLALLIKLPHGHNTELVSKTGYSKQGLAGILDQIWGKPVDDVEYIKIQNQ